MTYLRLRGGISEEAPPTPSTYGPSIGVDGVKAGTSPHAVTVPSGPYTTVNPGDNIATKITTAGVGGTLWFTKGSHILSSTLSPLTGQTWVLESASGYTRTTTDSAVIDGNNALVTALILGSVGNVTIRGGLWRNQGTIATASSTAAIQHSAGVNPGVGGWLVEDAIVANNYNIGITFQGPGCTARRCYVHSNGRYGLKSTITDVGGHTWEACRVSNNNTLHYYPGGDAGGSKFVPAAESTVSRCWFHDNYGSGIWFDYNSYDCDIIDNVVENNRNWGIFYEACFGGTYIRRNYLYHNGEQETSPNIYNSHQILCSTSDGAATSTTGYGTPFTPRFTYIDISYNQLVGSSVQLGAGVFSGRQMFTINTAGHLDDGVPPARNNYWHDNDVIISTRTGTQCNAIGAATGTGLDEVFTMNNTWEANRYHVPSGDTGLAWWRWIGPSPGVGAEKTWVQWQAYGHDMPDGELD